MHVGLSRSDPILLPMAGGVSNGASLAESLDFRFSKPSSVRTSVVCSPGAGEGPGSDRGLVH